MSSTGNHASGVPASATEIPSHWKWLLIAGIALVILGLIALTDTVAVTVISMLLFGWVLLIGGVVEAIQAVRHRHSGHLLLHVLNAVLGVVVGLMLVRHPLAGVLAITLLLSVYFVVVGIVRIAAASQPMPGRGWILASGIVSLILGLLIWLHWPSAAFWVIGLFIAIELIVAGWSQVMLATILRRLQI